MTYNDYEGMAVMYSVTMLKRGLFHDNVLYYKVQLHGNLIGLQKGTSGMQMATILIGKESKNGTDLVNI